MCVRGRAQSWGPELLSPGFSQWNTAGTDRRTGAFHRAIQEDVASTNVRVNSLAFRNRSYNSFHSGQHVQGKALLHHVGGIVFAAPHASVFACMSNQQQQRFDAAAPVPACRSSPARLRSSVLPSPKGAHHGVVQRVVQRFCCCGLCLCRCQRGFCCGCRLAPPPCLLQSGTGTAGLGRGPGNEASSWSPTAPSHCSCAAIAIMCTDTRNPSHRCRSPSLTARSKIPRRPRPSSTCPALACAPVIRHPLC